MIKIDNFIYFIFFFYLQETILNSRETVITVQSVLTGKNVDNFLKG